MFTLSYHTNQIDNSCKKVINVPEAFYIVLQWVQFFLLSKEITEERWFMMYLAVYMFSEMVWLYTCIC